MVSDVAPYVILISSILGITFNALTIFSVTPSPISLFFFFFFFFFLKNMNIQKGRFNKYYIYNSIY